jgi:FKBP-type peptidyl-prolyl cis-trans isomerase 2
MTAVKEGDTVKTHYTGKLEDGTVFDSSKDRGEPIQFTLGENQIIPGFEKAVVGMKPGQTKTETIPAEDAYGPRRDDLLMDVSKTQFPENVEPKPGQTLQVQTKDGQPTQVTVVDVKDEAVTLDANHPLAGKDLTFEIELVEILGGR